MKVRCGNINEADETRRFCGGTKNKGGGLCLLWCERTCAHDRRKHPALAVLDGTVARDGPHPQDVPAAGPGAGVDPLLEIPGPVPLQHAPVVFAVDLDQGEETKFSEFPPSHAALHCTCDLIGAITASTVFQSSRNKSCVSNQCKPVGLKHFPSLCFSERRQDLPWLKPPGPRRLGRFASGSPSCCSSGAED